MRKLLLYIVLLSTSFSSNLIAQDLFSEINIDIENINSKETLSVIDNENNIYLFFISSNTIHYVKNSPNGDKLYEDEYENSEQFIFENPKGYTITEGNKVVLFFSNSWNNKFKSLIIPNIKDGTYKLNEFNIKNKKEKFFFYANNNKKFFLYNYVKNSSIIKRYELEETIKNTTTIDLSKERFYNKKREISLLSEIIRSKEVSVIKNQPADKSINTLPNSIEISSKKIKVFIDDDKHLITLNHRNKYTRTISLTTNNDKFKIGYYGIPTSDFHSTENIKSNSFIFKDIIYQFICSKQRINLNAFNLNSKELIKEYKFNKDDDLTIMNSPIIQEGGRFAFGTKKELTKTSQFLRKTTSSQDVGLYTFERNGKLNITIGGTSEIKTPITSMPITGGLVGSSLSVALGAYVSYKETKSVFINCLFDSNFNHLDGEIKENIFDRIHRYEKYVKKSDDVKKLKLETVFEYKNLYIHGYYDVKNKKYYLRKHKA